MKTFTVMSNNPEDTYQYGIFLTRAIAAIMRDGLEATYVGQTFKVVEIDPQLTEADYWDGDASWNE